jgi:hypothetical protein
MPSLRTRSAGAKVTDEEYGQLEALAQARGLTLGEWCREVLLERLAGPKPSQIEQAVIAEVMALRTILLNVLFKMANGEPVTEEAMRQLIDRADAQKDRRAVEVLTARTTARSPKPKASS